MTMKDTETLDRLYLEWSQFTRAKTGRELLLEAGIERLTAALQQIVDQYHDDGCSSQHLTELARRALEPKP